MTSELELRYQKLLKQAAKSVPAQNETRPVHAIRAEESQEDGMTPQQLMELIEGAGADYRSDPMYHPMSDVSKQQDKNRRALDDLKKAWREILNAQIKVREKHLDILDKEVKKAPQSAHNKETLQAYAALMQEIVGEKSTFETYLSNLERMGSVY